MTNAYKAPVNAQSKVDKLVSLGDSIVLDVSHLPEFLKFRDCKAAGKAIVLAINGRPLPEQTESPRLDPANGKIAFELKPDDANRKDWIYSLGRPDLQPRPIRVGIAIQDDAAIASDPQATLELRVIDPVYLGIWLVGFFGLLALFIWLSASSNVLKGEPTDIGPATPEKGQYSLSRVQAAWWLFVILGAYMLIGLVTGEYRSSINGTALILLGIGAATAVASAAIDASKTPTAVETQVAAVAIEKKRNDIQELMRSAAAKDPMHADAKRVVQALSAEEKQLERMRGTSRGFLLDILSDANGVSIHRFQAVAWTLVLTIVFCREVYLNLAMADFSDTLLALQGLSAATYLGLKTTEAKVAK